MRVRSARVPMHASKISAAPAAQAVSDRARSSPLPGHKLRILIVDDNPEKTIALQSVIEELEYEIVVAQSAQAALRELLKQQFALALVDVHMPEMDGFELAALVRSRAAHQDLAIVFMSTIDQTDERLEHAY